MNESTLGVEIHVYFRKMFRINMREKSWKYLIFALIISLLVAMIVGPDMFGNFESTNSGFFTLASACIWIGIFNSIQSVCKEHEIIRAEYRQGMKIAAYVSAHALWQALLCLAQTIIIFIVCCIFMKFDKSAHLLLGAYVENFVTIYLLTFGASILGLMISSVSGNPTTAMTIMPFVLIIQLVMSGVLFSLNGFSKFISESRHHLIVVFVIGFFDIRPGFEAPDMPGKHLVAIRKGEDQHPAFLLGVPGIPRPLMHELSVILVDCLFLLASGKDMFHSDIHLGLGCRLVPV